MHGVNMKFNNFYIDITLFSTSCFANHFSIHVELSANKYCPMIKSKLRFGNILHRTMKRLTVF